MTLYTKKRLFNDGDSNSSSGGVSSINTLVGAVILAAGANITLTPVGNTITIDATGGGEDLSATLAIGNTTGGFDVVISNGDVIRSSNSRAKTELNGLFMKVGYISGTVISRSFQDVGSNILDWTDGTNTGSIIINNPSTALTHNALITHSAPTHYFSTGDVGIGIAIPTEKLHVVGNAIVDGKLTVTGIIDPTQIQFSGIAVPDATKYEVGFFGTTMFYNVPTGSTHDFKINDVNIASVTPTGITAATFTGNLSGTTVSATSVTTPLIIGGTAVGSNLIHKSTTGVGTTTGIAHQFTGGNNGATIISTQYNDGQFLIGTTTRNPSVGPLGILRVGQGTSTIDIGESSAGISAIWMGVVTPSTLNYSFKGSGTVTTINAPVASGTILLAFAQTTRYTFQTASIELTPTGSTAGVAPGFMFTAGASTGQTAGTESISVRWANSATMQHESNTAIATQRDFLIEARTHSFASATGTITDAVTFAAAGGPIAGTNTIITNNHTIRVASNNVAGAGTTTNSYALTINAQTGAANNYVAQFLGGNTGFLISAPKSTVDIAGSLGLMYVAKTATYTASATDYTIDCTANTFTVNLPTAVGITGRVYVIKNSTVTGTITVDAAGAETIDLLTTQTVSYPNAMKIQSNGANWIII